MKSFPSRLFALAEAEGSGVEWLGLSQDSHAVSVQLGVWSLSSLLPRSDLASGAGDGGNDDVLRKLRRHVGKQFNLYGFSCLGARPGEAVVYYRSGFGPDCDPSTFRRRDSRASLLHSSGTAEMEGRLDRALRVFSGAALRDHHSALAPPE